MNEPINHFDEMTCLLYLEGELDAPRAEELRAHAAACESCGAMLRALERESNGLASAFTEVDEVLPERLAALDGNPSPARWAWLLAFGLGGAAAYVVWAGLISPLWDAISQAGFGGSTVVSALVFNGAFWKGWNPMIDTLQTAALIALGIFAFSWLRLRLRRGTAVAAILGCIAMFGVFSAPASAAEVHHGQPYTLEKDQVIHDDLVVVGPSVEIDGTVDGDLIVIAQDVTVHGRVTGDILGFAQYLRVEGAVDGNIRGLMNTLTLDGTVGKNISVVAQSVDLGSDSKIAGSATIAAGSALIDGQLGRGIVAVVDQHTSIEGSVGGGTTLVGDQLSIGSTAVLSGPVNFTGKEPPDVAEGSQLASPVHFEQRRNEHRRAASAATIVHGVLRYGAAVLVGLLLMTILPGFFDAGLRSAGRWSVALGVGALTIIVWIFLVVASIVLLLIGVGAGFAAVALFFPIAYLAQIFVGAWIGGRLMPLKTRGTGEQLGRVALGLLIIHVLMAVPILGALVSGVVGAWGIGAGLLAIHEQSRRPAVAAAV
jgi:putative zinc finger protein